MKTKEERVLALITANVGWAETEKQFLLGLPDDKFDLIERNSRTAVTTPIPPIVVTPVPTAPAVTTPAPNPIGNLTPEQYIANAPPLVREMLTNALAAHNAEKQRLIGLIVANANNRLTKEYLEGRSLEELSGIAALAAPTSNQTSVLQNSRPIFMGAAAPMPTTPGIVDNEKPLALPSINWKD